MTFIILRRYSLITYNYKRTMGWGDGSWGNSGFGSGNRSGQSPPHGQHLNTCHTSHAGIGGRGHYEEHCPGCRRDRAYAPWGGSHKGNGTLKFVSLFIGMRVAKKSLWD